MRKKMCTVVLASYVEGQYHVYIKYTLRYTSTHRSFVNKRKEKSHLAHIYYHLGRLEVFTSGVIPSRKRVLILHRFTTLKMTLCGTEKMGRCEHRVKYLLLKNTFNPIKSNDEGSHLHLHCIHFLPLEIQLPHRVISIGKINRLLIRIKQLI